MNKREQIFLNDRISGDDILYEDYITNPELYIDNGIITDTPIIDFNGFDNKQDFDKLHPNQGQLDVYNGIVTSYNPQWEKIFKFPGKDARSHQHDLKLSLDSRHARKNPL